MGTCARRRRGHPASEASRQGAISRAAMQPARARQPRGGQHHSGEGSADAPEHAANAPAVPALGAARRGRRHRQRSTRGPPSGGQRAAQSGAGCGARPARRLGGAADGLCCACCASEEAPGRALQAAGRQASSRKVHQLCAGGRRAAAAGPQLLAQREAQAFMLPQPRREGLSLPVMLRYANPSH